MTAMRVVPDVPLPPIRSEALQVARLAEESECTIAQGIAAKPIDGLVTA